MGGPGRDVILVAADNAFALWSKTHESPTTQYDRNLETEFQLFDTARQARLGHVATVSRSTKVALLAQGGKILELAEKHFLRSNHWGSLKEFLMRRTINNGY